MRSIVSNTTGLRGSSDEAKNIDCVWNEILYHYFQPATRDFDLKKFCNLTATWQQDTQFSSSITQIAMHPAYQKIIGMGKFALPYILKSMQASPHLWFWALKSITGEDPVRESNQGDVKAMTEDWLEWGKANGYI